MYNNNLGVSTLSLHYAYSDTGILRIHAYPNTYMHLLPNIVPIPIYFYMHIAHTVITQVLTYTT